MISRGQVYFVNPSPTHGREHAGSHRFSFVFSDPINRQPLVVAVVVGADARDVPREDPTA